MNGLFARIDTDRIIQMAMDFVPDLVAGTIILFGFWLFFRATRPSLRAIFRRAGIHETLIHMLVDNIYRFVLIIFGLVMAADQVGVNVGAALAGLGVAGIAVGFAAQDSLANMIAGFLIFWDKPFEVGDWVTVGGEYGEVRNITMRTTRIRTNNNTYVVIPNKKIIDEVLVNHSKHGATRVDVPVGIAYKEDIPTARQVILAALKGVEGALPDPAPDVVVTALGSSSVDMFVRVWIADAGQERPVYYRTMEASKLALDRAGIEIPYHHLQLFIENVQEQVWQGLAALPARPALPGGSGEPGGRELPES